jgi:hypothetical protein
MVALWRSHSRTLVVITRTSSSTPVSWVAAVISVKGCACPFPRLAIASHIAYNSTVDGELASLADLAKVHIKALELFQKLLEQAKQARHNKKMDDVQAWQRIYTPSTTETLGRQLVRQLERVHRNPDAEWRSVYERLEEDAEKERTKAERRCAREEKQKEDRRKREANEKTLVEAGARRSERRVRFFFVCLFLLSPDMHGCRLRDLQAKIEIQTRRRMRMRTRTTALTVQASLKRALLLFFFSFFFF